MSTALPLFIVNAMSAPTTWHRVTLDSTGMRRLMGLPANPMLEGFVLTYTLDCSRERAREAIVKHFDRYPPGSVTVYMGRHTVGIDAYFQRAQDAVLFKLSM